jgi:hypothetical protein
MVTDGENGRRRKRLTIREVVLDAETTGLEPIRDGNRIVGPLTNRPDVPSVRVAGTRPE